MFSDPPPPVIPDSSSAIGLTLESAETLLRDLPAHRSSGRIDNFADDFVHDVSSSSSLPLPYDAMYFPLILLLAILVLSGIAGSTPSTLAATIVVATTTLPVLNTIRTRYRTTGKDSLTDSHIDSDTPPSMVSVCSSLEGTHHIFLDGINTAHQYSQNTPSQPRP